MEQKKTATSSSQSSCITNSWDKRKRSRIIVYAIGGVCVLLCVYAGLVATRMWYERQGHSIQDSSVEVPQLAEGEQIVYERIHPDIPGRIEVRQEGDLYVIDASTYGQLRGVGGMATPDECVFRAEGTAYQNSIVAHFVPSPGVVWTDQNTLDDPRFVVIRFLADSTLVVDRADVQYYCGIGSGAEGTYQRVGSD